MCQRKFPLLGVLLVLWPSPPLRADGFVWLFRRNE